MTELQVRDSALKPFAWSYSRLKAFEDCPRRYHETQVKKAWGAESSPHLEWGDAVHKAMATALKDGTALPTEFRLFQRWVDSVNQTKGEILVEDQCQWAVTKDLVPTPWFAPDVWLRTVADVVKLDPPVALVIDWKTGKSLNVDPVQLTLTSLMAFWQFPQIKAVRADFIWLNEGRKTTQSIYRSEMKDHWAILQPRIARFAAGVAAEEYPPMPGRFCRSWCAVKSCEYWGK